MEKTTEIVKQKPSLQQSPINLLWLKRTPNANANISACCIILWSTDHSSDLKLRKTHEVHLPFDGEEHEVVRGRHHRSEQKRFRVPQLTLEFCQDPAGGQSAVVPDSHTGQQQRQGANKIQTTLQEKHGENMTIC